MIVIDSSVVVEILLRTPSRGALEQRLFASGETLHAPHLLDVEVAQVIRRYSRQERLPLKDAEAAIADLADFPVRRYAHDRLLQRIWQLRSNLTAYDAAYVALAATLDAPLITRDRRMSAAPASRVRIEVI